MNLQRLKLNYQLQLQVIWMMQHKKVFKKHLNIKNDDLLIIFIDLN